MSKHCDWTMCHNQDCIACYPAPPRAEQGGRASKASISILVQAQDAIADRRQRVDGPEGNFERIAKAWEIVFGHHVSRRQVALCMIGLKLARECYAHWTDNLVDLCGYADCLALIEGDYDVEQDACQDKQADPKIDALNREWLKGLKPKDPVRGTFSQDQYEVIQSAAAEIANPAGPRLKTYDFTDEDRAVADRIAERLERFRPQDRAAAVCSPAPWQGRPWSGVLPPSKHVVGYGITCNAEGDARCGQAVGKCPCGKSKGDCDWPACFPPSE